MNHAEALHQFQSGRLHPHCPVCGETRLFINGRKMVRNFAGQVAPIVLYVCARCTLPFKAWIDPNGQEKESAQTTRETDAYQSADDLGTVKKGGSVDDHV